MTPVTLDRGVVVDLGPVDGTIEALHQKFARIAGFNGIIVSNGVAAAVFDKEPSDDALIATRQIQADVVVQDAVIK